MSKKAEPAYPPELKKLLVETHLRDGLEVALVVVHKAFPEYRERLTRKRASALSYGSRRQEAKDSGIPMVFRREPWNQDPLPHGSVKFMEVANERRAVILDEVWRLRKERHLTSKAIRLMMERANPDIIFPGPLHLLSSANMRHSTLAKKAASGEQVGQTEDYFVEVCRENETGCKAGGGEAFRARVRVSKEVARQVMKLLWRT